MTVLVRDGSDLAHLFLQLVELVDGFQRGEVPNVQTQDGLGKLVIVRIEQGQCQLR